LTILRTATISKKPSIKVTNIDSCLDSKDSLFITQEFLYGKKLRTQYGANQNSSLRSSNIDLLRRKKAVLVFCLKFHEFFTDYLLNVHG